ncbi:MAG TPA: hypothetical protein VFT22_14950, partial [Kofleriaceae bacterium]|nr:hypothetical protein [Kofleriaceae bacterium]
EPTVKSPAALAKAADLAAASPPELKDGKATEPAAARPAEGAKSGAAGAEPGARSEAAVKPVAAAATPGAVAFTPVKVKQSALANAVAKEVASSLFPRSVLVAIIVIQALVIVWLLLRH